MIKGWRTNPAWVALYDSRRGSASLDRHLAEVSAKQAEQVKLHAEYNARQKVEIEEQKRHRAECHASKEASGDLATQRVEKLNG